MKNIVIIERSDITGGTLTTFVVLILLGLLGIVYGIIDVLFVHFFTNTIALICFFAACGIAVVYISNLLIQAYENKKIKNEPVIYNPETKKVILTNIWGKIIEIKPSQISKVSGLSTFDNRLFITCKVENKDKKINVGFVNKDIDLKAAFDQIEKN